MKIDFRAWRLRLHLTQSAAAERIGRKLRVVQKYESGEVEPDRTVRLAMWAVTQNVGDYDGEKTHSMRISELTDAH